MLERLLNATLRFSIARRWLIVVAAILISVWGIVSIQQMPLDVFPPFAPPQVDIQTNATGLAPEEVEKDITLPIESALQGIPGVETVRSSSKVGLSMVQVVFEADVDINQARQAVAQRLQPVRSQLPPTADEPEISPLVSPLGTVLQVSFSIKTGGNTPELELRQLVASSFTHPLLEIPGVAEVTIYGGDELQQQVWVDPAKLRRSQISLSQVGDAAAAASRNAPGGFLIQGGRETLVRIDGGAGSSEALARSAVQGRNGITIPLGEVADVRRGGALRRGEASFNGAPAVVLMVNKQPDVDTPTVTRAVEQRINAISQTLPKDIQVQTTFRQANFIDTAIRNVSSSLISGVVIVALIITLFLMNWRAAIISLSAIPLSLLIGLLLMKALGLGINTMTLGGLVVAIGSVVDDSIVDMENCYRGLRRNQTRTKPKNPLEVVYETSVEVRQPVMLSTLIILVVFTPIFSLSGVEGRIFEPMGLAYLLSIGASTLVAVTVSPALCALLLAPRALPLPNTWIVDRAQRLYRPILEAALRSPRRILLGALACVVATALILPSLGRVFLPEFREQSLVNSMVLYPGGSLEMTSRAGNALSRSLADDPRFAWVQVRAGRAPGDADGAGVNMAHVDVELSDQAMADRPGAIRALREAFLRLPGVAPNVGGFISHRMDEVLSGVRSAIAVKIYGPDLSELRRIGEDVRDAIAPVEGVVDLQLEPQLPIQQIRVQFNRSAVLANGATVQELTTQAEIALNGKVVGAIHDGQQSLDLFVGIPQQDRDDLDAIRSLPLFSPTGTLIPLGEVASVDYDSGANVVNREDVSRLIVVSANVSDRPLGAVVRDIQSSINKAITLPKGYSIRYGGQFEAEERATFNLLTYSLLAAGVITLLMWMAVRSWPATLAIVINLPLALVGGLMAVVVSGGVLSIASLVGFITLFGVAVRNGLLLVDNYNRRHASGQPLAELLREGSLERLSAILMTALTSALGMLPLALAFGAGNEILQPLAVVVLGGLLTSTLLTLVVLPSLYSHFGSALLPATPSDGVAI